MGKTCKLRFLLAEVSVFPRERQKIRKICLFVCVIILFKNAFLIYYIQTAIFPSPSPHSPSSSNSSLPQIYSPSFCFRKGQASRDINQTRHKVGVKLDTFPHLRLDRATSRRKKVLSTSGTVSAPNIRSPTRRLGYRAITYI